MGQAGRGEQPKKIVDLNVFGLFSWPATRASEGGLVRYIENGVGKARPDLLSRLMDKDCLLLAKHFSGLQAKPALAIRQHLLIGCIETNKFNNFNVFI